MDRAALISRRLKLRHLNVLIEVVEQGSMAKAAKRPATSQPFVSKAMADLERMFGRGRLIRCGRWSSRRSGGLRQPENAVTAMSAPFAGGLLAKGGFFGVLGSVFCRAYVDRGHLKVLPVKLPADAWHITAATLRTRAPHPLAKMFLDCAREVAKPLSLSDADD